MDMPMKIDWANEGVTQRMVGEKPEGCKTVLVKNIPKVTSKASIATVFKKAGIEPVFVRLKKTKSSLNDGAAYVDLISDDHVGKALEIKDRIAGNPVTVYWATSEQNKLWVDPKVGHQKRIVYLTGIPKVVKEDEIRKAMGKFGQVKQVVSEKHSRCLHAFIIFTKPEEAAKALAAKTVNIRAGDKPSAINEYIDCLTVRANKRKERSEAKAKEGKTPPAGHQFSAQSIYCKMP